MNFNLRKNHSPWHGFVPFRSTYKGEDNDVHESFRQIEASIGFINQQLAVETNRFLVGEITALGADQNITVYAAATAGDFTITCNGNTTGAIAFNASITDIQNAVRGLAGCAAVVVSGEPLTSTTGITFNFPSNPLAFTIDTTGLTPATGFDIQQSWVVNEVDHDREGKLYRSASAMRQGITVFGLAVPPNTPPGTQIGIRESYDPDTRKSVYTGFGLGQATTGDVSYTFMPVKFGVVQAVDCVNGNVTVKESDIDGIISSATIITLTTSPTQDIESKTGITDAIDVGDVVTYLDTDSGGNLGIMLNPMWRLSVGTYAGAVNTVVYDDMSRLLFDSSYFSVTSDDKTTCVGIGKVTWTGIPTHWDGNDYTTNEVTFNADDFIASNNVNHLTLRTSGLTVVECNATQHVEMRSLRAANGVTVSVVGTQASLGLNIVEGDGIIITDLGSCKGIEIASEFLGLSLTGCDAKEHTGIKYIVLTNGITDSVNLLGDTATLGINIVAGDGIKIDYLTACGGVQVTALFDALTIEFDGKITDTITKIVFDEDDYDITYPDGSTAVISSNGIGVYDCYHPSTHTNCVDNANAIHFGSGFTVSHDEALPREADITLNIDNTDSITSETYDCAYRFNWTGFHIKRGCGTGSLVGPTGSGDDQEALGTANEPLKLGPGIVYDSVAGLTGRYLKLNLSTSLSGSCLSFVEDGEACTYKLQFPENYDCTSLEIIDSLTLDSKAKTLTLHKKIIHFVGYVEETDDEVWNLYECPPPA